MPIVKAGWAELLEPTIREWFSVAYNGVPSMMAQFFDVVTSDSDHEMINGYGAVAIESWRNFKKSRNVSYASFDKGYKSTFTHDTFEQGIEVEKELIEDNKYPQVMRMTNQLAVSAARLRETDAASVFNNAMSSSYPGADAVALCDNSHPHSPDKPNSTQDNLGALALSYDNVRTARLAMRKFTDDVGQIVGVVPDWLLVPPDLEDTAMEIAETAKGQPGSANNTLNTEFSRGLQVKCWPYLTDTNRWFLIDSVLMKQALIWFDRVGPSIDLNEETVNWARYVGRMRYSYGWVDWRWVYGSEPS